MTLEDSIQRFRLRVLREAVRSGNISATCQRYEISADGVLSVAPAPRAVWARRRASETAGGSAGPAGRAHRRRGTLGDRGSPGVADARAAVGQRPTGPGGPPRGASDGLARAAAAWAQSLDGPLGGARGAERGHRAADRAHGPPPARAPRCGRAARRVVCARHVLRREAERRGQGLVAHGLRLCLVVWLGARRGGCGHRGGHGGVSGRGRRARLSRGRLAPAPRADRQREGVQGELRHHLCGPPGPTHADEAAACVDQRVRGTPAGDDSP